MKILVTGGAGYIGSVLVPTLLQRGCHVTVVDNFTRGDPFLSDCCINANFEPVRGDARDMRLMQPLLRDADMIVPLAALVGAPLCKLDEVGAVSLNRDAVINLLARLSPEQGVVFPNSNSGYGTGDAEHYCTEESPLRPLTVYSRTKVEAEAAVLERRNGIALRLATVFGMSPRMRLDLLVNEFTWRAVHDRAVVLFEAHFRRNYIHVRDVAKAFLHAIDHFGSMRGRPYNVGLSEANFTKLQLCERIAAIVPGFVFVEAPIGEDPDKRDYLVSNARLEATGWRPDYSVDAGIRELVKGFAMIRNGRMTNV